jgi:glycerophosphoryl diester phosphodiesterase
MAQAPSLIETDVRMSADGVFVLLHDSELDRTTTGEGPVAERSWAELEPLRLVDEEGTVTTFSIPRLDEALAWADGRVLLQLDVKRGVDLQGVARAVLEADAADSTMLIAYTVEDAAAIHSVSDKLTISLGMDALGDVEAARSAGVNVNRVVAWTGLGEAVNAPFWHRLDAVGVPVAFGTMWNQDEAAAQKGDDSVYAELAVRGVDILATDRPRAAFRAVTDRAGFEAALATCGA